MKPIFEIKQEGGIFHLYGDRLGERVTLLAASKFKNKLLTVCITSNGNGRGHKIKEC